MKFVNALALTASLLISSNASSQPAQPKIPVDNLVVTTDATVTYDVPISKFLDFESLDGNVNVVADYITMRDVANDVLQQQRIVKIANPVLFASLVPIGRATATITTPLGEKAENTSTIQASVLSAFGNLTVDGTAPIEVDLINQAVRFVEGPIALDLKIKLNAERLPETFSEPFTSGQFDIDCKLSGETTDVNADCSIAGKAVEIFGQPFGDLTAKLTHKSSFSEMSVATKRGSLYAKIPFVFDLVKETVWKENETHELSFDLRKVGPDLMARFFPIPEELEFEVRTVGTFSGSMSKFDASLTADGTFASGGVEKPISARLFSKSDAQELSISVGEIASFDLKSDISIPAQRKDEKSWLSASASGQAALKNVPLAMLIQPFKGVSNATGTLSGDFNIGGTLGQPTVKGDAQTQDAEMNYAPLNRRFKDGAFEAKFEGSKMTYEGTANVKNDTQQGLAAIRGDLEFSREATDWKLAGRQTIVLNNAPFVRPDYAIGRVSGTGVCDISLQAERSETSCDVQKTTVNISPERLPRKDSIARNPNIKFVDQRALSSAQSSTTGNAKTTIVLSDPIRIIGDGIILEWQGKATIDRVGPRVKVDGGFSTTPESKISIFENDFKVVSGYATFTEGDLRRAIVTDDLGFREPPAMLPIAEIVLEGKVNDTYVLAKLSGEPSKPRLDLSAIPALPEYQIITLLVLGRIDSVDDRNGNVRRAAAKIIERYHNPSLQRQLFDRIGVDKVGIKFGKSVMNPILTVGKQINRLLYVQTTYRHDVPPDTNTVEARVERRVATKWRVDTTFGDAAEGSVGLFWYSRFGGPKGTPPTEEDRKVVGYVEKDEDGDSVEDRFDLCLKKKEDVDGFEDQDGCPDVDNDGDGIADIADKAPNQRETFNGVDDGDGAPDEVEQTYANFNATMTPVLFEYRGARIGKPGRARIATFAQIAKDFPDSEIVVSAYSDTQGTEKGRAQFANRRGAAARSALRRAGVPAKRIVVESFPTPPDGVEGEAQRQVRIRLVIPEPEPKPDSEKPKAE